MCIRDRFDTNQMAQHNIITCAIVRCDWPLSHRPCTEYTLVTRRMTSFHPCTKRLYISLILSLSLHTIPVHVSSCLCFFMTTRISMLLFVIIAIINAACVNAFSTVYSWNAERLLSIARRTPLHACAHATMQTTPRCARVCIEHKIRMC